MELANPGRNVEQPLWHGTSSQVVNNINSKGFDRNYNSGSLLSFEPPRGTTNNVVSEQVRHKPACTSTEKSYKLEILELSKGGIVLSE